MASVGIYLLMCHNLNILIWLWLLLFFLPDLSMVGYFVNAKIGAITYNVFHHKGIAIAVVGVGYFMQIQIVLTSGIYYLHIPLLTE